MSAAQSVVDSVNGQAGGFDATYQVFGVIHFAVAVCHGGEVEADMCQAKGGGVGILPVPQCFHDEKRRFAVHRHGCAPEYADDFFFRKAVEELAHPDTVETFRERHTGV